MNSKKVFLEIKDAQVDEANSYTWNNVKDCKAADVKFVVLDKGIVVDEFSIKENSYFDYHGITREGNKFSVIIPPVTNTPMVFYRILN